jgi:hypothetical protein
MSKQCPPNPGTLLLYWDYELQCGAERSRGGPKAWGGEDHRQTERLLDLLDKYEMKATFAVLGYAALEGRLPYHASRQVREIAERGHEVASHTWEHEWIPTLTYKQLKHTLKRSKEQLERVTGRTVISFAPPWNAPNRYLRRAAIGLYDWRHSSYHYTRIDIPALCRVLAEVGYKTSRIGYEPIHHNLSRHLLGRVIRKPTRAQWIEGILCFQVNGSGFADDSIEAARQAASTGRFAVLYAHPHSLIGENKQSIGHLVPFLEAVSALREEGRLVVTTPGEVCRDWKRASA